MRQLFLIGLMSFLLCLGTASATEHVDATNCPGPNAGTLADPHCTVQEGVDAAVSGETVSVAAGTYAETISFVAAFSKDDLTISGDDPGDRPFVTGGVNFQNTGAFSGLTLRNLYLTGDGGANRIVNMGNPGAVNDLTMDNCVLDGENVAGRSSFYGAHLGGFVTITDCEIKDVPHWSAMDLDGSGGTLLPKTTITFTGNNIHDCDGAVALRGHNPSRTDLVEVANNTWNNICSYAALEINYADVLNVHDNTFTDVDCLDAQAIQAHRIGSIDIYLNNFHNVYFVMWLPSIGEPTPTGSVHDNCVSGTPPVTLVSTVLGTPFPSDVNAEDNYWGTDDGASISARMLGEVDFTPFSPVCNQIPAVPAVSEWGIAALCLILLAGLTITSLFAVAKRA